jgi:hypothetical protein
VLLPLQQAFLEAARQIKRVICYPLVATTALDLIERIEVALSTMSFIPTFVHIKRQEQLG